MSQVAGFKAVDAEGNELGVVSMNELTESISEQVLQTISMRNQATTLEQPVLMSAASTLAAGNDAYENELPEQTDLKWARALDASGNPILISKESLASVVGGLLPIVSAIQKGLMSSKGFIERTDINDANTRFCGFCRGAFENTPITGASILISIMNKDLPVGLQLNVGSWPVNIYIRPVWDLFEEWKQIY